MNIFEIFDSLAIIGVMMLMYFFPSILAHNRNHKKIVLLFFLNFSLGWTGVAWWLAFYWAISG
ncbi:MAG: hypothetical protein CME61_06965 [Halobacteriovoraceae bacterium]|nr:hypothetical protein [Halobacteriovoraceae bacterium]